MSSFLELHFSTPSGIRIATVFTDANGHVTSEHGLSSLLDELRRRKKVKTPPSLDPAVTKAFFDLSTPVSPKLEELRQNYLRERNSADSRGCSKCDRAAIYRKYVVKVNEIVG
jgi:hypothetical protein